jgi:dTDP-4-amino-4,6-dideoxygalactose transaminase
MKIPFVDLKAQYHSIKTEIDTAIANVIADTAFVGGSSNKYVVNFEKEFAAYLNMKHTIACANGTDSIEILLEAYGVGPGDEVIVPAVSWISSSEAVGRTGAKPVFVDVVKDTLLIDTDKIEEAITPNTKVMLPVHLYGNAVDMNVIMQIAEKHKLIVIEDCAQAHGSRSNGKLVGTLGHASSFSFYPGKNLGAYGDAGGIVTNNDEIATKCRMIANHGQLEKHKHLIEGRNSRMDGLHGAVLSVKLKYLDKWNALRNEHAKIYAATIFNPSIELPVTNNNSVHVFHLFVVKSNKRDELKKYLEANNIETAIHYPTALPFVDAYKKFNYTQKDFPVAFHETKKILSIPMFPELSKEQMSFVVKALNNFNE